MKNKIISASQEDYLEAIFNIIQEKKSVKAIEISKHLGVGKSSVTEALRALAAKDLVNYAPYDPVTMTALGEELAKSIVQKHSVLANFFENFLGTDKDEAVKNACRIEHVISENALKKLASFMDYIDEMPLEKRNLIENFKTYSTRKH